MYVDILLTNMLGTTVISPIIKTITIFKCDPSFFIIASTINLIIIITPTIILVKGKNNTAKT